MARTVTHADGPGKTETSGIVNTCEFPPALPRQDPERAAPRPSGRRSRLDPIAARSDPIRLGRRTFDPSWTRF